MLLAIATLVFIVGNAFSSEDKAVTRKMLGHDFLAFYTAGSFVREGRIADLYDLPKVAEYQRLVSADAGLDIKVDYKNQKFGPWWNPPFYAWVFAPLSYFHFNTAVAIWTSLNVICLGLSIFLLMKMVAPRQAEVDAMGRPLDWRSTGLIPLLIILSMPFVQAISHGQNTMISLFLTCAVASLWRAKRAMAAGMVCALLCYKPQLAAVLGCILMFSLGLRAVIGFSFIGSVIVLFTQISMPGAIVEYIHKLPQNIHYMQVEHAYMWERHATLKGFWRLLIQGREAGEMALLTSILHALSFITLGVLLVRAAWSHFSRPAVDDCWASITEQTWRDRLIAATVVTAPLLMPFYFDYDLLLLALPATLLATEWLSRTEEKSEGSSQKWLFRCWLGLYAWMIINPGMSNLTRVNLNVVLLTMISVMMIRRATRPAVEHQMASQPVPTPVRMHTRAA